MNNLNRHDIWGIIGHDAADKNADIAHSALHLGHLIGLSGRDIIAPVNLHALGRQIVRGVGDERGLPCRPQTTLLQAQGLSPQQRVFPGTVVENVGDLARVNPTIIARASHIIALPAMGETCALCRLFAADRDAVCKTMCVVGDKPDMHQDQDTAEMARNLDTIQFFDAFMTLEATLSRKILDRPLSTRQPH